MDGRSTDLNSFFFNDTATTEIYTLSLHDALPIYAGHGQDVRNAAARRLRALRGRVLRGQEPVEDRKSNTSELQSRQYLVCRLLLEKKKLRLNETTLDRIDRSLDIRN